MFGGAAYAIDAAYAQVYVEGPEMWVPCFTYHV